MSPPPNNLGPNDAPNRLSPRNPPPGGSLNLEGGSISNASFSQFADIKDFQEDQASRSNNHIEEHEIYKLESDNFVPRTANTRFKGACTKKAGQRSYLD